MVNFFQRELFLLNNEKNSKKGGASEKKSENLRKNLDFSVEILDLSGTEGGFAPVLSVKC